MTEDVATAPEKSVKRTSWAVLALALATPSLMGTAGFLSAYKVGEITVQVGFAWMMAAVAIDLLTRKRDAVAKANGRIVAAVLALVLALASGFNVYRNTQRVDAVKKELIEHLMASTAEAKNATAADPTPTAPSAATPQTRAVALVASQLGEASEADRVIRFLNAAKKRSKEFAEESETLERRFNAVDLSEALAPQSLVNKTDIEASRTQLNVLTTAIAERDAMLKRHYALSEQIIRSSGLTQREVNKAMDGMNSGKGVVEKTYADVTTAQLATVKATDDVLTFAQRRLGRTTVLNGQLLFQTQSELDEYTRLIQVLQDAAAVEASTTQRAQELMQRSKQALVDKLK